MMKRFLPLFLLTLILLAGCSGHQSKVTWETASEVDTAGFNLYRATSPDGPWEKINDALIPPSQDPIRGGSYEYFDKTAQPGQSYYYQLEEVELSGSTTRFDPIQAGGGAGSPPWYVWVAGILIAITVGWFGGTVFPKKQVSSQEE